MDINDYLNQNWRRIQWAYAASSPVYSATVLKNRSCRLSWHGADDVAFIIVGELFCVLLFFFRCSLPALITDPGWCLIKAALKKYLHVHLNVLQGTCVIHILSRLSRVLLWKFRFLLQK